MALPRSTRIVVWPGHKPLGELEAPPPRLLPASCASRAKRHRRPRVFQTYGDISNITLMHPRLRWPLDLRVDARRERVGRIPWILFARIMGCMLLGQRCWHIVRDRAAVPRERLPARVPRCGCQVAWWVLAVADAPYAAPDRSSGGMPRSGTGATTCRGASAVTLRVPGRQSPVRSCRGRSARRVPLARRRHCL